MQYNKRVPFVTALFAIICFVCGASLSAYADGLISGKVISDDNQPIPGIFVDASDPCGGNWYGSGKSDAQGEYEISLPAGTYYLSTEASDYVGQWWKQTIQCTEAQAVVVNDGQTISGIDFQLQGIGSISGKISTSDDQPIAGVKVNVFEQCDGMLRGSNTTGASGTYLIEGLSEGNYYVSTYSEKYPGKWWDNGDGASECGDAAQISVSGGENTSDIDFRLGAGEVSGRIESSSGQPLASIRVEATDAPCGGNWYGEAVSDASGNYLIPALVSGSYSIHAYDESNTHSDKWWDNVSDCNESSTVSVSEGQTLSGINFSLDESSWISGQITDKRNGQPIPNIGVRISDLCGENESGHAFTDESGHYSIPIFLPGDYYVFVSDENGAYQNEWWDNADGTDNCKNAAGISIAREQKVSADFQLEVRKTPGEISGKVMNSLGQAIEGISVGVWGLCHESWYGGNSTDAHGNYAVTELPEGEDYYVFAFDPSGKYVSKWWHHENGTMDCENAEWIRVVPGQTTSGIDIQLDEGGEIAGQISSGMGNSIEGIQVDVWDSCEGTWYGSGLTNESGNYSISGLPPGTYHIFVSDEKGAYPAVWWNNGTGVVDCSKAAPLTVTANQTTRMNITLEQKGSISGTVIASDSGQPVRDVCVNAWDLCREKWYGEAKTDEHGKYVIGLQPGSYYLATNASCDGQSNYHTDEWWNSSEGIMDCNQAAQVSVSSGQETPGIDFQLDNGGAVSGEITANDDGHGIGEVCVGVTETLCGDEIGGAWTDDEGNYSIFGVPPGNYYIFTKASCLNPQNYADKWWNKAEGTSDCGNAEPINVIAGQTAAGTDFSLFETGIRIDEGDGVSVSENGISDSYSVRLNAPPSEDVTVSITHDGKQQIELSTETLIFTKGNWNQAQTVKVTATDDELGEGPHTSEITHSATGGGYDDIPIQEVTVNITDDSVNLQFIADGGIANPRENILVDEDSMPYPISVAANSGYRFVNWTSTPAGIIEDPKLASTTVSTSADAVITAHFAFDWSAKVSISPPQIFVTDTTEAFEIEIIAENVNDLGAFQFDMGYDSDLVSIERESDIIPGDFLGSTGRSVKYFSNVANESGQPLVVGISSGSQPGTSGKGILEKIRFMVRQPPEADKLLTIENLELTNAEGPPYSVLPTNEIGAAVISRGYVIKAGEEVFPTGEIIVGHGEDKIFAITPPDKCHRIADVLVDGVSIGPVSTYRFKNMAANHTIRAEFERKTYTISTDENNISVNCGADQPITLTPPDECHRISDILVDGASVLEDAEFRGEIGTYTFKNVVANHLTEAVFERNIYTITTTSDGSCSISPSGTVAMDCGADQAFIINCDEISVNRDVLVDGVSVGSVTEYVFHDMRGNHTIRAASEETQMHSIDISVIGEGIVTPGGDASGRVVVAYGSDQIITIKPAECHVIEDVLADGESVTEHLMSDESTGEWSYTFPVVAEDHSMKVRFTPEIFMVEILTDGEGTGHFSLAEHGEYQDSFEVTCGDDLMMSAIPDECSVFENWSENGNISETDDFVLENIRSDRTVTATFNLIPKGDVNQDGDVDIGDAILSLRLAVGGGDPVGDKAISCTDVNKDARIGMEEAIYLLRNLADTENL